jgi:NAD-dependent deacetylase
MSSIMPRVLILSGAGLSAESGLKTFRDHDGMWENYNVMDVCSVDGFSRDRDLVNSFYDKRREELANAQPNLAHHKIAELKNRYPRDIAVVTQNVDDLLERAGCEHLIHLHGTLVHLRCEDCGNMWRIDYDSQAGVVCPKCESDTIRHNVVMFGESAPMYGYLEDLMVGVELFIVVGSSGQVLPLGHMAQRFEKSILNNLYPDPQLDINFSVVIHKPATEGILDIEKIVEEWLEE